MFVNSPSKSVKMIYLLIKRTIFFKYKEHKAKSKMPSKRKAVYSVRFFGHLIT